MRKERIPPVNFEEDIAYVSGDDTDEEIQEAFRKGLIGPGGTFVEVKKHPTQNDQEGMAAKLEEIRLDLPWVERMDLICTMTEMGPHMAFELKKHSENRHEKDIDVNNDFSRELCFYRQAQTAVLEGIPKLHRCNVKTKRPNDCFVRMVKDDKLMKKVRKKIVEAKNIEEKKLRTKKFRELKKFGKQIQIAVRQEKQSKKNELLQKLKDFRKGQLDNLDFLQTYSQDLDDDDEMPKRKRSQENKHKQKRAKFGAGRHEKGWKRNRADDLDNPKYFDRRGKIKSQKRPGKNKRKQLKAKRGKK